jgi:hypothetical protein
MKQTKQVVLAIKQSILLRYLWFGGTAEISQLFYLAAKNFTTYNILIWFLMRIPKWGLPFLYLVDLKNYCKKTKNTTFVRFSDYYLNIPLLDHNFLSSLH